MFVHYNFNELRSCFYKRYHYHFNFVCVKKRFLTNFTYLLMLFLDHIEGLWKIFQIFSSYAIELPPPCKLIGSNITLKDVVHTKLDIHVLL